MVSGMDFSDLKVTLAELQQEPHYYQWQNNEWVLVGYHSKRLPDAVRIMELLN